MKLKDHLVKNDFDGAINLQNELIDELEGLKSDEDTIKDKIELLKFNLEDMKMSKDIMNSPRSMKMSFHQNYLSTQGSSQRKTYLRRMRSKKDKK